jgi:RimJ/RimL family protein N-acetyltransferase
MTGVSVPLTSYAGGYLAACHHPQNVTAEEIATAVRSDSSPVSSGTGVIRFRGRDITSASRRDLEPIRREMQMVFQDPQASLNPRKRVSQILRTPLRRRGVANDRTEAETQELLRRVGLQSEHLNRFPHEFSGGQRQRIGIARASRTTTAASGSSRRRHANFSRYARGVSELTFPEPPLRAQGVLLRPWGVADVQAIVAACQDPTIPAYMPHIPSPYSQADAISWLDSQEPNRLAGTRLELAIADAGDERLLGAIGASNVDMTQLTASVGYWLAPHARGRGHATWALRVFARWLFDELGLARLELTADPANTASQRVAEGCGFHQEGYLRSHLRFHYTTGERRDSLIYGLLPDELT